MKVHIDATSITPSRSAGVETFTYGLVRGLHEELGDDGMVLHVRDSNADDWAAQVGLVPTQRVRLCLDANAGWQSRLRAMFPDRVKRSSLVRQARLPRTAGAGGEQVADGTLAYYPFHRVPTRRGPNVITAHDFRGFTAEFKSRLDRDIVRANITRASAVVCSWPHPYQDALHLFPEAAEKIFLVPLPVFNAPKPMDPVEIVEDDLLLYPASTGRHKNHATLLRAMAKVPGARLLCAGPLVEPEASRLKALVAELGLSHRVTFTGFISEIELRRAFGRCAAVVVPTRWEAASGPIYEALAWKKPVVASNIEPVRAQLAYVNAQAELFDPLDPDDLAKALRATLGDLPARRRLAAHQVPWLSGRTWRAVARDYAEVFRWVVGEVPRPTHLQPESAATQT